MGISQFIVLYCVHPLGMSTCKKRKEGLNCTWAKLPKSGKLEKLKKNYNFLKIVSIDVDFCSHIVKFDSGLRNNFLEFVPSFILFIKIILCF